MPTTKQSLNKRQKSDPRPSKKRMSEDDESRALEELEKENMEELMLDSEDLDESTYMGELDLEEMDIDSPTTGKRRVDRDPDCNRIV
jgi:hypothetical protein